MSSVKGVEVNEFSRFIDHTLATPWETFISDIEKRLRSIQGLPVSSTGGSSSTRGIVEFMNLEFEVRKVFFHGDQSGSGVPDNLMKLISGLNVNLSECIILIYSSETNGSQIIDPQLRGTILSAFSIAIRSMTDWTYPVFFTLNSLRSPCLDWMGYRPTFLKLSTDQKLTSWSRFESLSLNIKRLSEKHPLFFFDGIRKVYQQRVSALGMITDQRVMEQFVSHITHYYLFDITQWLGNPEKVIGRIKYPLIPNILNRDLDELLRMLLLRKMSFTMETLSGMNVSIDYREGNQHGVIDNESYSTLLPSRQSAQQFHLYPDWKPAELQQPFTEHETMILPWKSHSIRNLLVFLILASFTKKQGDVGYNFENNYTLDEMMNGVQYEEMAEFVSQLSVPTQTAFYNKIPTGNIAAAASVPGHFTQSQPRSTSSNSSSRPMTPSLNPHMLFPISVSEVTSPKTAILNATASSHNVTGARGRGQSMSSMSSSASLATNNTLNNSHTTSNHNSAGNDQQAIENDRYFQPVLRYLFQTEPSAPLAELFSPNGNGGTLGKHAGPGIFLDVLDLSKGSIQEATKANVPMTNQNTDASTLLALPYPADGVHIWLEQFAVIAGLLPTKTTNIIRLWQHCLRELQQHFDLQSPVPAFSHIVGNTQASSVNHLNTKSSSSQDVQQQSSSFTPMDEDEVLAERRAFIAAEKSKPLYARMLWEDVLHRKGIDEDLSVTIPRPPLNSPFIPSYLRSEMGDEMNKKSTSHKNIYSSVLLQQLQMVHFCTVVQGESVYASNPVNNTPGMVKPFNDPPSLLRRIPLTEDMLALQHHLSQKMFHDTSRTFQANPILKFQVVLPNLVSHMQSFKQANPSATVEDFYHWYGLDSAPASLFSTILHDEEHEAKASEVERVAEPAVQEVEGETNEGDSNAPEEETGPSSFSDPNASAYLASLSHPGDISSNEDTKIACSTEDMEETGGNRMKRRLLKQLETIWQTHCTNGDQTPPSSSSNVFSADKEMTKAMAFLERMSVSGLAEELLYLAVCFSWRILQHSASSLPSAAARNLAEKAVKPVQQEILELQRLRERYPSSTHTTIMRRMFLQSLEESSPLAASAASYDPPVHSDVDVVSPVTPPRDLPVHDSTNVPLDTAPKMLPPLQMPHSPFPQPSALAAVTTLQELVTAYDRLANAMACAEDRIHRLLQLSPVEEHITELFSGENAFSEPLSPFVKSPSPQRTKKVSVTRTTTGDTHVSFNPNDTTNAARWTQMLHLWLPQSRPASGGGTLKYQLRDEREKLALLQRMKTLTAAQTLASAAIGGSVTATAGGTASGGTSNTAVAGAATEWHSTDGRELGAPSSKRFVLRALLPTSSPYVEAVERAAEDSSDALDAAPVTLHFDDDEDESQDTVSPSKKSTSLIFDVDEDENPTLTRHIQKDEHDIALTVYCDRENLHAMWEYLEED